MSDADREGPLDKLFVDQNLDVQLLADTILPYVRLFADTREILFTEAWENLALKGKLLTYLLARKAMKESRRFEGYEEGATPTEIESETELKGGSIRPTLSKLVDEKLIRVSEVEGERKYRVPNHVLRQISSQLTKGE